MDGFTAYLEFSFVISFLDVLLFLMLLLKIFSLHIHGLIVLVCAVLICFLFSNVDFWPFRTASRATILFVVLLGWYLIILFKKNNDNKGKANQS